MTKIFNFFQYQGSGQATGVGPFNGYDTTQSISGLAQFYTPENILSAVINGNFPLLVDVLYPSVLTTTIAGNIPSTNLDRVGIDLGFSGGFSPYLRESSKLFAGIKGKASGDNLTKAVFDVLVTGSIDSTNLNKVNFNTPISGVFSGDNVDKLKMVLEISSVFSGDNIDSSTFDIGLNANLFQPFKTEANINFLVSDITFEKGNVKTTELLQDSNDLNFVISKIQWSH